MTRNHLFAMLSIAALAACGGTDTTDSGTPPAGRTQEVQVQGYRLVIQLDAAGKPTSAQAWDPSGGEAATQIGEAGEVTVCAPAATASGSQCEPLFSFVPEGTTPGMGTASCTCFYIGGWPICYGGTCK
jgi:hypothetical protein